MALEEVNYYIQLGAIILGALVSWIFTFLYSWVKHKSSYGWHMWRMSTVLALVFSVSLLGVVVEVPRVIAGPLASLLLLWLAFETSYRLALLIQIQVRNRKKEGNRS